MVKKYLENTHKGAQEFYTLNGEIAISGSDDTIIFNFSLSENYPEFTHEIFRKSNIKLAGVTELNEDMIIFDS